MGGALCEGTLRGAAQQRGCSGGWRDPSGYTEERRTKTRIKGLRKPNGLEWEDASNATPFPGLCESLEVSTWES